MFDGRRICSVDLRTCSVAMFYGHRTYSMPIQPVIIYHVL